MKDYQQSTIKSVGKKNIKTILRHKINRPRVVKTIFLEVVFFGALFFCVKVFNLLEKINFREVFSWLAD